jgi:Tfp pilus assembly protein PilZ
MLHVQASEVATNERKQITIRNYAQLVSGEGEHVSPDIEGDLGPRSTKRDSMVAGSIDDLPELAVPAVEPEPSSGADAKPSRLSAIFGRMFGGKGKGGGKASGDGDAGSGEVKEVRLVGEASMGKGVEDDAPAPAPQADAEDPSYSDIGIDLTAIEPEAELDEEAESVGAFESVADFPAGKASLGLAGGGLPGPEERGWDDHDDLGELPVGNLNAEDLLGLGDEDDEEAPLWGEDAPSPVPPTEPTLVPPEQPAPGPRKKPARLKMNYRSIDAFVIEYRRNLERDGCFIRTPKPLPLGRECIFEVRIPGIADALVFEGVVTWSSAKLATLSKGQEEGMGISYRMEPELRAEIQRIIAEAQ